MLLKLGQKSVPSSKSLVHAATNDPLGFVFKSELFSAVQMSTFNFELFIFQVISVSLVNFAVNLYVVFLSRSKKITLQVRKECSFIFNAKGIEEKESQCSLVRFALSVKCCTSDWPCARIRNAGQLLSVDIKEIFHQDRKKRKRKNLG